MYTVWQSKKKIYIDNLGWSCTIVKQQRHIYVPDTVQAEVIGERINRGGGYRLVIPVLYHFYGHKNGVSWLRTDQRRFAKI